MDESCQTFVDLLFEPEEDLSNFDSAKLAEHLQECPTCRQERELFIESWDALDEFEPELDSCLGVRARVWEQIREEENLEPPLFEPQTIASVRTLAQRILVGGLALTLGFWFGRGVRPAETPAPLLSENSTSVTNSQDFLDPTLIKLASEDGFSMEIFPETTTFSPLDQEMRSALAPSDEDRDWLLEDRPTIVPIRYISQNGTSP